MSNLMNSFVAKANSTAVYVKHTLPTVVKDKMRGDDKLVVSLVLIAVAVMLCWIFRDAITYLFVGSTGGSNGSATSSSLMGQLTSEIGQLFKKSGANAN